jgi:hypothetical protein
MQTSWFTETLRSDLEAAGSLGSDKAMKIADRMITITLPLAKARMLEAMSMALTELAGAIGIERIDLRVSGDDVTFVPTEAASTPRPSEPAGRPRRSRGHLHQHLDRPRPRVRGRTWAEPPRPAQPPAFGLRASLTGALVYTFNTPGPTRVVVYNPVGGVDLVAEGSGTTTVELIPRGTEGEAVIAETSVECTDGGGTSIVTVTLPSPRTFSWRRSGVDIQVRAPEGVDVVVSSSGADRTIMSLARSLGGDVRLRGTVGDVDVSLPSADVSAQVIGGTLSIKTASGDVDVGTVEGTVKVRSVSGDVSIDETNDDVSLTLVSGDLSINTANRHVDATSVSGDVTVTDAKEGASVKSTSGDVLVRRIWRGDLRAATVSGDVTVGVPPGRGVSVDARSMSGELSSEIDLHDGGGGGEPSGDTVRITAHSVSGDVHIQRAAGS